MKTGRPVQSTVIRFNDVAPSTPTPDRACVSAEPPPEQDEIAQDEPLDLVRHILPNWDVEAHSYAAHDRYWVAIWPKDLKAERCFEGRGETLELAVLIAVLKALAFRDGAGPGA